jgi:hypothetical protein
MSVYCDRFSLETGQGRRFVLEQIENLFEVNRLQSLDYALGSSEELALGACCLERSQSAHECSDAGTIQVGNLGQVDGEICSPSLQRPL